MACKRLFSWVRLCICARMLESSDTGVVGDGTGTLGPSTVVWADTDPSEWFGCGAVTAVAWFNAMEDGGGGGAIDPTAGPTAALVAGEGAGTEVVAGPGVTVAAAEGALLIVVGMMPALVVGAQERGSIPLDPRRS